MKDISGLVLYSGSYDKALGNRCHEYDDKYQRRSEE